MLSDDPEEERWFLPMYQKTKTKIISSEVYISKYLKSQSTSKCFERAGLFSCGLSLLCSEEKTRNQRAPVKIRPLHKSDCCCTFPPDVQMHGSGPGRTVLQPLNISVFCSRSSVFRRHVICPLLHLSNSTPRLVRFSVLLLCH